MAQLYYLLKQRTFLWLLLIGNILGTIYGYVWYKSQLLTTPFPLNIFVPDSPTASLFFCFVVALLLINRSSGFLQALALVSLVKYGLWAVFMNLLVLFVNGTLHWTGYMLMASHLIMAVQGLLYIPFYRIKPWHWGLSALWLFHNDFLDYVFNIMPYYSVINEYPRLIGYFTFWLSVATLTCCYVLDRRSKKL